MDEIAAVLWSISRISFSSDVQLPPVCTDVPSHAERTQPHHLEVTSVCDNVRVFELVSRVSVWVFVYVCAFYVNQYFCLCSRSLLCLFQKVMFVYFKCASVCEYCENFLVCFLFVSLLCYVCEWMFFLCVLVHAST